MENYISVKCPKCKKSMYVKKGQSTFKCASCGDEFEVQSNIEKEGKPDNSKKNGSNEKKKINVILNNKGFANKNIIIILVPVIIVIIFFAIFFNLRHNRINNQSITQTNGKKKTTYIDIKKELGINIEQKNGYNSQTNKSFDYGNYKFFIPSYYSSDSEDEVSYNENDFKFAKIKFLSIHDEENTINDKLLTKELRNNKIQDIIKNWYDDIEILDYEKYQNSNNINGIMFEFVTNERDKYFKTYVFGDSANNDWYYIIFEETIGNYYEYNGDFDNICKNFRKLKDIAVNKSSLDYKYKNYNEVVTDLKKSGFYNIETSPIYDLVFGWLTKDGETDKLSINKIEEFSAGDMFKENSKIIVSYHTFPSNETITEKNDKVIGTYIGNQGSAITIHGDNSAEFYYKCANFFDKDCKWEINDDKININVPSLSYNIYADYYTNMSNGAQLTFNSTNSYWQTENFKKINNEDKSYTKEQFDKLLSSSELVKQWNYKDLANEMKYDGYINIELRPKYDIYMGWLSKEGDIDNVIINGESSFNSYLDFDKDAKIIIEYHVSYEEDPSYKESVAEAEESKRITEANKLIGWQNVNGEWYYYNDNGKMQKSKWIDDTYYVDSDGKMLKNTERTIWGDIYIFDANGMATKIEKYELVGKVSVKDMGFYETITGIVRNNTNRKCGYLRIKFDLYDSSGAKVGSASDSINDIEAGGTWRFEADAFVDFSRWKLVDISGF